MKSLRYKLLGRPVTLEDVLDFSRKSRPRRVAVRLGVSQFVGDLDVPTQLVASLAWEFADRRLTCHKVCGRAEGGCPSGGDCGVARANRRLEELSRTLASTGADVVGADDRFVAGPPWVAPRAGEEQETLAVEGEQA